MPSSPTEPYPWTSHEEEQEYGDIVSALNKFNEEYLRKQDIQDDDEYENIIHEHIDLVTHSDYLRGLVLRVHQGLDDTLYHDILCAFYVEQGALYSSYHKYQQEIIKEALWEFCVKASSTCKRQSVIYANLANLENEIHWWVQCCLQDDELLHVLLTWYLLQGKNNLCSESESMDRDMLYTGLFDKLGPYAKYTPIF
jgi:hypothetical protein